MKKRSVFVVAVLTLLFACALVGCNGIREKKQESKIFTSGDFICYPNEEDDTVSIVALTGGGMTKDVIIIPKEIGGKEVVSIGARDVRKVFASQNLKKLYIPYLRNQICVYDDEDKTYMDVPNAYVVPFDESMADYTERGFTVKKVVVNRAGYEYHVQNGTEEKYVTANVSYNLSESGGSVWMDYVAPDAPQGYMPTFQVVNGESVVAWYVDPEKTTLWNGQFDKNYELYAQYGFTDGNFWLMKFYGSNVLGGSVLGKGNVEKLVIPETIDGKPVEMIGMSAFAGNKTVKEVAIPDSVVSIASSAFKDCSSLTKVSFGINPGLTDIYGDAFAGCTSLKSFFAPDSLRNVYVSFRDSGLETVDLNKVTTLYEDTFTGCGNLKRFTVSEDNADLLVEDGIKVYYLNHGAKRLIAYANVSDNKILDLPEYCTRIGMRTLMNNHALEELKSGDSVYTEIYDEAFKGCDHLKKIDIKACMIGQGAFSGCEALETVILRSDSPASEMDVRDDAFAGTQSTCKFFVPSQMLSFFTQNAARIGISGTIEAIE